MNTTAIFNSINKPDINNARLEHLDSIGLSLSGKTVVEVGAGIGNMTQFWIDKQSELTVTDGRPGNVEILKTRYPDQECLQWDVSTPTLRKWEIVFCYGLLYHIKDPSLALANLAHSCDEMLILSTCVNQERQATVAPVTEDSTCPTNSITGDGCRPSRLWVWNQLQDLLEYVYMPRTQPRYAEFPTDWDSIKPHPGLDRAVFIASRLPVESAQLSEVFLTQQSLCQFPLNS